MKNGPTPLRPTTRTGPRGSKHRLLVWIGIALVTLLVLVAAGVGLFKWRFHYYTADAAVADFRAGLAARHAPHPAVRFLELRHGPLDDPANRQKAFLHFLDPAG